MGLIANLARKDFPGANRGRQLWENVFGSTSKEDRASFPKVRGDSYGRSAVAGTDALKRLLVAMRSRAPGGWSDNRWEQTGHQRGIPHICIHRAGEILSQAEFRVMHKDPTHPDGKRPITKDEFAYKLVELLEEPNNEDTFGDLMYKWWQQLNLTGSALTWFVPNAFEQESPKGQSIIEMYSIPTAIAIPQPVVNPDWPHGFYRIQPVYPYGPFSSYPTPATAVGAPIGAEWIMKFKFPHPLLHYDGLSPLTAMNLYADEIEQIDRSRWYKMKRSTNPDAVLDLSEMEGMQPLPEPEIDRIHAEWENEQQGAENAGKLIVGTPGAKLEQWGTSPKEMDYANSWSQLADVLMPAFGMTKPVAGMMEDTSYATLFAALKQVYWLTFDPFCNRVAARLTRRIAPYFGDDLLVEVRCKRIDDHEVLFGKIQLMMDGKALTKGRLLKMLDEPLFGDKRDDELAGESEQEMQMEQMKAEAAMVKAKQPGKPAGGTPDEAKPEPSAVAKARPSPGNLSRGALGPRGNLGKSLYRRVREMLDDPLFGDGRDGELIEQEVKQAEAVLARAKPPAPPRRGNLGKSLYRQVREVIANGNGK